MATVAGLKKKINKKKKIILIIISLLFGVHYDNYIIRNQKYTNTYSFKYYNININ